MTAISTPAQRLIEHLRMEKIPDEGAWFALTWGSQETIPATALPPRYGSARRAGSAIYALITSLDFSALHRLKTDELWHFYGGDPAELLLLEPDGNGRVVILGPDVLAGQHPQFTVPAGTWMGARPQRHAPDAYSFFGNTLSPGFDYADFEPGYRDELQRTYPAHAALIGELTRPEFFSRPTAR